MTKNYDQVMDQIHMTEAEAARDFHAVLERVKEGTEIVIEEDHLPVAIIRTLSGPGRTLDEAIAIAQAFEARLGYAPIPDEDFARDVQEAIEAHREQLNPPAWD
jgi:antitoxin (DNA-binding transcriptional repressor) of toxin-antitoxin stability system